MCWPTWGLFYVAINSADDIRPCARRMSVTSHQIGKVFAWFLFRRFKEYLDEISPFEDLPATFVSITKKPEQGLILETDYFCTAARRSSYRTDQWNGRPPTNSAATGILWQIYNVRSADSVPIRIYWNTQQKRREEKRREEKRREEKRREEKRREEKRREEKRREEKRGEERRGEERRGEERREDDARRRPIWLDSIKLRLENDRPMSA